VTTQAMRDRLRSIDRRTALRTIAAAGTVGVAGCNGGGSTSDGSQTSDDATGTDGGSGSVIQALDVTATELVVTVAEQEATLSVFLVNDAGETVQQGRIQAGTQTRLPLLSTEWLYSPGEYTVVVKDDDETLDEASLSLEPDLRLRGVGLVRNHPEIDWGEEVRGENLIFASLENRGSGPAAVDGIMVTSDSIDPIGRQRASDLSGWITRVGVPVGPGNQKPVRNLTSIFSAYNEREAAGRETEFEVKVSERLTQETLKTSGVARYTDSNDDGIVERVQFEFKNAFGQPE